MAAWRRPRKAGGRRRAAIFLLLSPLLALLLAGSAQGAAGGFIPALTQEEVQAGDTLELTIVQMGSQEVGAALFRVEFDAGAFSYQGVRWTEGLREGVTEKVERENWVAFGYVLPAGRQGLSAGDALTCRFKVNDDAQPGAAVFSVSIYQALDREGEPLPSGAYSLSCSVLPPPSGEAALLALEPSEGQLEPAFDPERVDYQVTVPFSVTAMTFFAQPSAGATCKVNRKNLGAGGTTTEFLLTVTAEDRKTRTVYRVAVTREAKETTPKPTATPKPAATPKPTATAKPMATPKPTATPKPSATPKPAVQAAAQGGAASPSPAASARPTETPAPTSKPASAPARERAESAPLATPAETAPPVPPVLTLRAGGDDWAFPLGAGAFLLAAIALSRPLATLLAGGLRRRKKPAPPEGGARDRENREKPP